MSQFTPGCFNHESYRLMAPKRSKSAAAVTPASPAGTRAADTAERPPRAGGGHPLAPTPRRRRSVGSPAPRGGGDHSLSGAGIPGRRRHSRSLLPAAGTNYIPGAAPARPPVRVRVRVRRRPGRASRAASSPAR